MRDHLRPTLAFTLVELLVVVTIIVVLLALLAPGLDNALGAAERAYCGANLRGAGTAIQVYASENNNTYTRVSGYQNMYGKRGTGAYGGAGIENKPLNKYLGYTQGADAYIAPTSVPGVGAVERNETKGVTDVPIARCPSDRGDSQSGYPNEDHPDVVTAYDTFGVSYLPAAFAAYAGVKPVFGANPLKRSQITRTDNKVMLGDWVWYRPWSDPRHRWHDNGNLDVMQNMILFADGHVEWFPMPVAYLHTIGSPNPSNLWW